MAMPDTPLQMCLRGDRPGPTAHAQEKDGNEQGRQPLARPGNSFTPMCDHPSLLLPPADFQQSERCRERRSYLATTQSPPVRVRTWCSAKHAARSPFCYWAHPLSRARLTQIVCLSAAAASPGGEPHAGKARAEEQKRGGFGDRCCSIDKTFTSAALERYYVHPNPKLAQQQLTYKVIKCISNPKIPFDS